MLTDPTVESRFLSILPAIETHARIVFRDVRCLFTRDERIADTVALAWKCFVRLVEKGKDVEGFKTTFASTVARSVSCGRRVAGMEKAKDVMSSRTQRRHGFTVSSINGSNNPHDRSYGHPCRQREADLFDEPLKDNTVTPVPDQAAFRIDFKEWLRSLSSRERKIVRAMLRDERTLDLSSSFAVFG